MKRLNSSIGFPVWCSEQKGKKMRIENTKGDGDNGTFPRFSKGIVEIILSDDPKYHYRFHKAVLDRSSTWFKTSLAQPWVEAGKLSKGNVFYRYSLHGLDRVNEPNLIRICAADLVAATEPVYIDLDPVTPPSSPESRRPPIINQGETLDSEGESETLYVAIKGERYGSVDIMQSIEDLGNYDGPGIKAEAEAKALEIQRSRLECYNNLFLMFYNKAPKMESMKINKVLKECEALVCLAKFFGCLEIVRPYLGNILCQFRQDLYRAIKNDPPRWLLLSIPIQSGVIFTEAVIHCAGCWPMWDWRTTFQSMPTAVAELIQQKFDELSFLRAETERNLFVNTIRFNNLGATLSKQDQYDSWMVVSIFRDWLANCIQLNKENDREHLPLYLKDMRKGGNAYLTFESVSALLRPYSGANFGRWGDVRDDLEMVKDHAENEVRQITKNNLMLDPDEAHIRYLTCTKISPAEFPWNLKKFSDSGSN